MTETDGKRRPRMARAGETLAILVVVFGVIAQIGAIALGDGGNYWPFLRYPMYSRAGSPTFAHEELCVTVDEVSHSLTSPDLGVTRYRFFGMLRAASRDTPAGQRTRDALAFRVGRYYGADARIELWQADYRMTADGLEDASPPWRMVKAWAGPGPDALTEVASPLPALRMPGTIVRSGRCGSGER
ncbi:MAG: hypothetical protein ACC682_02955 [Gemmatimonadota bacterium]